MKRIPKNTPWYSTITALLLIGFLLVLTTSTLNLVLQEMQDGRWRQNYMKAYAGAEGAMELWLLKIKQKWYGYWSEIQESEVLWSTKKDAKIDYSYDGRVQSYSGTLAPGKSDIIPLFWIDDSQTYTITDIDFIDKNNILQWNILTEKASGASGHWSFDEKDRNNIKKLSAGKFIITPQSIHQTLLDSSINYLIVLNPTDSDKNFVLSTWWDEYFTTPREILSTSARVWKYRQNIDTTIDNTEFLGISQYSIYSE